MLSGAFSSKILLSAVCILVLKKKGGELFSLDFWVIWCVVDQFDAIEMLVKFWHRAEISTTIFITLFAWILCCIYMASLLRFVQTWLDKRIVLCI